jgi:hypothetical protein
MSMPKRYKRFKFVAILLTMLPLALLSGCKPAPAKKSQSVAPAPVSVDTGSSFQTPIGTSTTTTPAATAAWQQTTTFAPLSGCLKNQPMQQVEIVINGAIEAPSIVEKSAKTPRNSTGVPAQMTFEFNTGLAYSATDAMTQLRNSQGRIIIKDLASYSVDQIAYIKISLDGHSYQSTQFSEWDFWSGQITKYQVAETNRFLINSLSVLINGQEFYRLGALGKTLSAGTPIWKEENLAQNLVTKKQLQQDCTAAATVAPAANGAVAPVTPTQP